MKNCALLVCTALVMAHCGKSDAAPVGGAPVFDSIPQSKPLLPQLTEVSGIADSRMNKGYLWAQEDSGNPAALYLIGHDGKLAKTFYLKGIMNRDWEDMALVNGEIYIGDIGDNNGSHSDYVFYKVPEPGISADTLSQIEAIRFTYPDGAHDAEAFLVDAATEDIYIITKRDQSSLVFRISPPFATTNRATLVGRLPYSGVVSAASSADGKEIIVKTYLALFYYKRQAGQTIMQGLQGKYSMLPYKLEPQGEAVSFAADGSGFYTLSEKGFADSVHLFFYKRR